MAIDPATIALAGGLVSGLFKKRSKPKADPFQMQLQEAYSKALGVAQSVDYGKLDQEVIDAYNQDSTRGAEEALSNYDAVRTSRGETGFDSEKGIARGTIAGLAARDRANFAAKLALSRPERQIGLYTGLFNPGMGILSDLRGKDYRDSQSDGDTNLFNLVDQILRTLPRPGSNRNAKVVGALKGLGFHN